ncbi:MAG: Crp/Fnr family transcriptional regulator [Dysgonomonas sp.]
MDQLRKKLKAEFRVGEELLDTVCDLFEIRELEKGDLFLKSNTYCKHMAFIKEGLMRVFVLNKGKEITQWISREEYFITDLSSFLFKTPARWNIEALTSCTIYNITHSNYEKIASIIPSWATIEKQFITHCFTTLENRVFQFLSLNAEERYQLYFEKNKDIISQVPQQYIASMLGMTPETLSRIKRKAIS